ncbi:MAG: ribosome-associated translation inhibitor RaiA [Actinomycetota bacterium]
MELVLTARGLRLTDEIRNACAEKFAKLERHHPSIVRIEVEIIAERNPRLDGTKRVEALAHVRKRRFRAHAEEREIKKALERVAKRLGRQLREHRDKKRTRAVHGSNRLKSARTKGAISS